MRLINADSIKYHRLEVIDELIKLRQRCARLKCAPAEMEVDET